MNLALEVNDLTKSFVVNANKISILSGLSIQVAKGQVVAILGQSGSGKSTFLSLLSGLDEPDQVGQKSIGSVVVNGTNLTELKIEERTKFRGKNIGIVFQQFHLIPHLTAFENVLLPLEIAGLKNQQGRARDLLLKMNLADRFGQMPGRLSGGEAQRVALARALVTEPEIILADEPSGSLDPETGEKVMNVFFEMVRRLKTTAILVTHNPELAKRCDRQLTLRQGQLHASL